MTEQIIVCEEKHGTYYWAADTPERWAASSLAILTQRWTAKYWYPNPDSDGLGFSKWADQERAERDKALAMTPEQIEALPKVAAATIKRIRRKARRDSEEDREYRDWYQRAKACVEQQDRSLVTVGSGRWAHDEPVAWRLLDFRSDAEYERVTLERLEIPLPAEIVA